VLNNLKPEQIDRIFNYSEFLKPREEYTAQQKMVLESYGKVHFDGEEIDAMNVLAILQYVTDTNERVIQMLADDKSECRYLDEGIVNDFWMSNRALAKEIEYRKNALF